MYHPHETGDDFEPISLRIGGELGKKQGRNEREGCPEIRNDVHTPASGLKTSDNF
jgi:hypothetical protein